MHAEGRRMPPYCTCSLMFWSILSFAKRNYNVWVDTQRLRNLSRVVMIVLYLRWDDGLTSRCLFPDQILILFVLNPLFVVIWPKYCRDEWNCHLMWIFFVNHFLMICIFRMECKNHNIFNRKSNKKSLHTARF